MPYYTHPARPTMDRGGTSGSNPRPGLSTRGRPCFGRSVPAMTLLDKPVCPVTPWNAHRWLPALLRRYRRTPRGHASSTNPPFGRAAGPKPAPANEFPKGGCTPLRRHGAGQQQVQLPRQPGQAGLNRHTALDIHTDDAVATTSFELNNAHPLPPMLASTVSSTEGLLCEVTCRRDKAPCRSRVR